MIYDPWKAQKAPVAFNPKAPPLSDEEFAERMTRHYCVNLGQDPDEIIPEYVQIDLVSVNGEIVDLPQSIPAHPRWQKHVGEMKRFLPMIRAYEAANRGE